MKGQDGAMTRTKDIIIINDDGVYRLNREVWENDAHRIDPDFAGEAAVLVRRGSVVADVPTPDIPIGYYCFLLNLARLQGFEPSPKGAFGAQVDTQIGTDGLVIFNAPNEFFIVREEEWRTHKERELGEDGASQTVLSTGPEGIRINFPLIRTPSPEL
jgi:hypothetical protein